MHKFKKKNFLQTSSVIITSFFLVFLITANGYTSRATGNTEVAGTIDVAAAAGVEAASHSYAFASLPNPIITQEFDFNHLKKDEPTQNVSLNSSIGGELTDANKEDTYKVKMKKAGKLTVEINSEMQQSANVSVCKDDYGYTYYGQLSQQQPYKYEMDVPEGTYIISVNAGYMNAKGKYTVSVKSGNAVTSVSPSESQKTLSVGESFTLKAVMTPPDAVGEVKYSSSDNAVATVSQKGKVVARKVGKATITIQTLSGGLTASCEVTVKESKKIQLNYESKTLTVGETLSLKATISSKSVSGEELDWTSHNDSVATVSEDGTVTALAAGTCTISVKDSSGSKPATCKITVEETATSEPGDGKQGFQINNSLYLDKRKYKFLVATSSPVNDTNQKLVWESSDSAVAEVNINGMVTGVSDGMAVITAKTPSGEKAYCTVLVR